MLRRLIRLTGILLGLGAVEVLSAAGGAIGMAVANGSFQVDHSAVYGNGTLFDGSVVETAKASSWLQLTGVARMRLAGESRAKVYQHRLVLEQGLGEMEASGWFEVEARSLHIAVAPGSVARVKVENGRAVLVSAVRGALRVMNAGGILVASMETGNSMVFEPQAGAEAPTRASGCLLEKGGKFLLAERTTKVLLELQGGDLEKQLGNQVEISGRAMPASSGALSGPQLIKVAGIRLVGKGGCTAIAKKLGAATVAAGAAAAGAGAAGASAGAAGAGAVGAAGAASAAAGVGIGIGTVAVIGGVAAAATVGGLAAVGDLPGQSGASPPASR